MSSPDEHGPSGRNLTIIVIPHDELESRSFVIPYKRLRTLALLGGAVAVLLALALAALFPVMIQAARASKLEQELEQLEHERARVAELAQTLAEVEAQYEKVRQMLGADAPAGSDSVPVLPPLRPNRQESPQEEPEPISFAVWPLSVTGFVTRGANNGRSQHPGLDIAAPSNSYIRAVAGGTVRTAGLDDVYGQYVVIDHGRRVETLYAHASRLLVTAGDRVNAGDTIALTGSSGRSTAPHLHFEVRREGRAVDPARYVRQP